MHPSRSACWARPATWVRNCCGYCTAIRATPAENIVVYLVPQGAALDRIAALNPALVVPGHQQPANGTTPEHRLHEGVPRGVRSVARGRHDTRAAAGANQGKVPGPGARHRPADRFGGGAGAPVRPVYDGWMFAAMFAGPLLPRVANTAAVTHVSADKTTAPHGGS